MSCQSLVESMNLLYKECNMRAARGGWGACSLDVSVVCRGGSLLTSRGMNGREITGTGSLDVDSLLMYF